MSSEFLKNIPPEVPFRVPEGYFGELHEQIMARTRQEGIIHASLPRRTAGSADLTFQTPPGYFESLPARISGRINQEAGGPGNRAARNPSVLRPAERYKIAAAACVALLLGVLGILQVAQKRDTGESAAGVMSFDQETLVQEYLKTHDPEDEDQPDELETYLLNQVEEGMLLQEL